jgi:hypothetical protein
LADNSTGHNNTTSSPSTVAATNNVGTGGVVDGMHVAADVTGISSVWNSTWTVHTKYKLSIQSVVYVSKPMVSTSGDATGSTSGAAGSSGSAGVVFAPPK